MDARVTFRVGGILVLAAWLYTVFIPQGTRDTPFEAFIYGYSPSGFVLTTLVMGSLAALFFWLGSRGPKR